MVFWPIVDIGPNSLHAAAAVQCAGLQDPSAFWTLHDLFFEEQGQVYRADRTYYSETAARIGLDQGQFDACFDGGEAHDLVQQLDEARRRQGIRSRPSFDINGELLFGARPFGDFQLVIEAALNG